jgi:hypothetical protein
LVIDLIDYRKCDKISRQPQQIAKPFGKDNLLGLENSVQL